MRVEDVMQRNVTSVADDESLGLALQLMLWNDIRHLPVVRSQSGRVVGVLSERDVLRARHEGTDEEILTRPVADFMQAPPHHIHPKAPLADAAADFNANKFGCLPVIDAGQLVGIITVSDVLSTVAQYPAAREQTAPESPTLTAASLMRTEPIAARTDDALLAATAKMLAAGIRHVCVIDGDGRLLGMVSDRDVRSAVGDPRRALEQEPGEELASITVGDVMTPNPRAIAPDTSVHAVLDTLVAERFGALPVVDADDRLVGIISYLDVLRFLGKRLG